MQSFTEPPRAVPPTDRRQSRRHGRRRADLPPWAVVALAAIAAGETIALTVLAAGFGR